MRAGDGDGGGLRLGSAPLSADFLLVQDNNRFVDGKAVKCDWSIAYASLRPPQIAYV